jgi:ribosomal protein L30E
MLVYFTHKKIEMVACLHQIKIIDYRRSQTLIGKLDTKDFQNIKTGLKELYDF